MLGWKGGGVVVVMRIPFARLALLNRTRRSHRRIEPRSRSGPNWKTCCAPWVPSYQLQGRPQSPSALFTMSLSHQMRLRSGRGTQRERQDQEHGEAEGGSKDVDVGYQRVSAR